MTNEDCGVDSEFGQRFRIHELPMKDEVGHRLFFFRLVDIDWNVFSDAAANGQAVELGRTMLRWGCYQSHTGFGGSLMDLADPGMAFIEDLSGFSLREMMKANKLHKPSKKKYEQMTQGMFPVRFAKMYLAFPPWWMRALMAVMGLFMSKKIKDRFQLVTKGALQGSLYQGTPGLEEALAAKGFGSSTKGVANADKAAAAAGGEAKADEGGGILAAAAPGV